MKHLKKVSSERRTRLLLRADAKQDFVSSVYRDVVDFYYAKMTDVGTGGDGGTGGAVAG